MTTPNSNWEKKFWSGLLREEDGTPSFSRLASLALVATALIWISYVVFHGHVLPELHGIQEFIVTGVTSLYGVNKGVTAAKSIFNSSNSQG